MGDRCLVLGNEGTPYPLVELLWDAMLWYYVEENVTDFVIERYGRLSDLVRYIIQKAHVRYPMLQYIYLEYPADLKAEIDKSRFLIIDPERSCRMGSLMEYAMQRKEQGLLDVTVLEKE